MLILRFAMDQSLGAYQNILIGKMVINSMIGVNNLVENTKVTLLEQGLAIVSLDALKLMNPNGNGVIAVMVIGTTNH